MKRSTVWAVYYMGFMLSAILWMQVDQGGAMFAASLLCVALCCVLYMREWSKEREAKRP